MDVDWADINLQDLVEEARAELYREQAEGLRQERSEKTDCHASLRAGSQ